MKHLELDWPAALDGLDGWDTLSLFTRRAALDHLRPAQVVAAAQLGPHLDALHDAGLIARPAAGGRWLPHPAGRPLLQLVHAFAGCDALAHPDDRSLAEYLGHHFDDAETAALLAHAATDDPRRAAARAIGDAGWLRSFLDADDVGRWEHVRREGCTGEPLLAGGEAADDLRTMIHWLTGRGRPVPLLTLRDAGPDLPEPRLARALHASLRYALALAGVDRRLEPVVGCWPPAARTFHRARPEPAPRPVEPKTVHDGGWALADVSALVACCAAEPPRLKVQGNEVFQRHRPRLVEAMTELPEWVEAVFSLDPSIRLDQAMATARQAGLLERQGRKPAHLRATEQGLSWLAADATGRLRHLLDLLIADRQAADEEDDDDPYDPYEHHLHYERWKLHFAPRVINAWVIDNQPLYGALAAAFGALEPDRFFDLGTYVEHQVRHHNPLPEAVDPRHRGYRVWFGEDDDDQLEDIWRAQLHRFLIDRMIAFGGLRLGIHGSDRRLALAATDAGRYLLGLGDDFDLGPAPAGQVIVQPDFEVVFLAPSPMLEATVGRLAERLGHGVGALFRITRQAVLRAAAGGLEAEQAIQDLAAAAAQPLPDNVVRQMHDWFAAVRRISARKTMIFDCGDAETATRVLAAGGRHLRPLSDTVLELTAANQRAAVLRKLREQGIFTAS